MLNETLAALKSEHADLVDERGALTRARTQVDCLVRDAEEASRSTEARRNDVESELERVEAAIEKKEAKLRDEAQPAFQAKKDEQEQAQAELDQLQVTLNGLYARQGRRGQFRTRSERDDHLQKLIDQSDEVLKTRRAREEALVREHEETEKERKEAEAKRAQLRTELDSQKEKARQYVDELKRLQNENGDRAEHRKYVLSSLQDLRSALG